MSPFGILFCPPFDLDQAEVDLPANLAAAIKARFDLAAAGGGVGGITKIYESQAGDKATPPYLVFQVTAGPTYFTTDVQHWRDDRVSFKVYASTQDQANRIRDTAIAPTFGVGAYDYRAGFTIPFFQGNQSEGKEAARGKGGGYVFRSQIDYSARSCREQGNP